jgi:hypothetical protein
MKTSLSCTVLHPAHAPRQALLRWAAGGKNPNRSPTCFSQKILRRATTYSVMFFIRFQVWVGTWSKEFNRATAEKLRPGANYGI